MHFVCREGCLGCPRPGLAVAFWQVDPLDNYARLIRAEIAARQRQINDANKELEQENNSMNGHDLPRKRQLIGTGLLPSQYNRMTDVRCGNYTIAYWWSMAHSWTNKFGLSGFGEVEDQKCRALLSQSSPPVLLLELNSKHTFNMLDPVLCTDFLFMMDAYHLHISRCKSRSAMPLAAVLQGAGPHLCPGGNHHPVAPPGATPYQMASHSVGSLFIVRMKELSIPSVVAITGNAIGGGVAVSLNCTERVITQNGSAAFGNLSRGACPIMFLSKHLPQHVGLTAAIDIYLTDSTVSACAVQKAGLASRIAVDNKSTKATALALARKMASFPTARLSVTVQPALSFQRYDDEAYGIYTCGRMGQMHFP
ncbi:echA12, partial [Symbiodinium sp. CCMP2456]